jgi:hypothetical protein
MGGNSEEQMECIGRNRGGKDYKRGKSYGEAEKVSQREGDIWGREGKPENSSNHIGPSFKRPV